VFRHAALIGLLTLAVVLPAAAADPEPANETDPWIGKARSEVEASLGSPSKSRRLGEGGAALTYKLLRFDAADAATVAGLIHLPGAGWRGPTLSRRTGAPSCRSSPR
jgi:hypothetical protein